jgi:hypothetical protein
LAENYKIYKVLLSSPNDVQKERKLVEDCVAEVNSILNRFHLGIKLWKWEKDSFSSIGESGQEVINTQLGKDYDIYLGVMWSKLGSPINNSFTGTENEFNTALEIFHERGKQFDIKFYFSCIEIPKNMYSDNEIEKVIEFKRKVQECGVLTKDYNSLEEFQVLVRLGLVHKILDWYFEQKIMLDKEETEAIKVQIDILNIELTEITNRLIIVATKFQNIPVEFTEKLNGLQSNLEKMSLFEVRSKGMKLLDKLNKMMINVFNSASTELNHQSMLFKIWVDKYTDILLLACSLSPNLRYGIIKEHLVIINKMKLDFLKISMEAEQIKELAIRMKKIHTKVIKGAEKGILFAEQFGKSYYFYFSIIEQCEQDVHRALKFSNIDF